MTKLQLQNQWEKIVKFCNYSERCSSEVRNKLSKLGVPDDEQILIIDKLKSKGFLDDARYARSYTYSKFQFNGWGKVKIRVHLIQKEIDEAAIQAGNSEIDDEEYRKKLENLAETKKLSLCGNDKPGFPEKQKIMRYLVSRGYESDQVRDVVNRF